MDRTVVKITTLEKQDEAICLSLTYEYDGSENYKAVDLIDMAYARMWGDVRTWIYINVADNLMKTKEMC